MKEKKVSPVRKNLSKKIRFEIFKRDSFQCQYCGSKAPDAVLEVDHIVPVIEGGGGDIMNLITSCFSCNRGKGKRKISDSSVVEKQRKQIEELNLRRQQLEMMLEWKNEVSDLKEMELDAICQQIFSMTKWNPINDSRKEIKRLIKKFGFKHVSDAVDDSFDKYYNGSERSWEIALGWVERIATHNARLPHEHKIAYCLGILRNRFRHCADLNTSANLIKKAYEAGGDLDDIQDFCKSCVSWEHFFKEIKIFINEQ